MPIAAPPLYLGHRERLYRVRRYLAVHVDDAGFWSTRRSGAGRIQGTVRIMGQRQMSAYSLPLSLRAMVLGPGR